MDSSIRDSDDLLLYNSAAVPGARIVYIGLYADGTVLNRYGVLL